MGSPNAAPYYGQELPDRVYLERKTRDEDSDFVLAFLPYNTVTPYATWAHSTANGEDFWGNYHRTLVDALKDYNDRVEKLHRVSRRKWLG